MAVYRELKVDIPKSHVTIEKQKNGMPALIKYVIEAPFNREKGYAQPKRTTIGHQCQGSTTLMHPTSSYQTIFPKEWEELVSRKVSPIIKRIGMFTSFRAVNEKTGIKDILDSVYGVDVADSLMDYVMYNVLHHSDASYMFSQRMHGELIYSKESRSDSWYSDLFEHRMTDGQMEALKEKWAKQCKADGVEEVWVCIDGSNGDCRSEGVELAEKGKAKSGKNVNIVSYSFAVTTDGKPVTFDVYRGGLVDKNAMKKLLDLLEKCEIKLKGVIMDRGYCDAPTLKELTKRGIPYVIMIKGSPQGYEQIVSKWGTTIKMNAEYLVPKTCLFGVQESVQLFSGYKHKDHVTLFYDLVNGAETAAELLKKVGKEVRRLEKLLQSGMKEVTIDAAYTDLLELQEVSELDKDGKTTGTRKEISVKAEALQPKLNEKGLYGIVTSSKMPISEVHELYSARNVSETQYSLLKRQLGYESFRVHFTKGLKAKMTVAFIASAVRFELEMAAKSVERSTNEMIQEISRMEMTKIGGAYAYTHTENRRMIEFFKALSGDLKSLVDASVAFENDRLAGRVPAVRHRKTGPKKGSHHKALDESGQKVKRQPGVKPGTKRPEVNADGSERRKPGVIPGTKRGMYNKDGSLRQKSGPKPGSHHSRKSSQKS